MVNREYHEPICLGTGSSPLYPYEGMKRNRVEPVASISFKRGCVCGVSGHCLSETPTAGDAQWITLFAASLLGSRQAVSYTHLTLPTNREV